MRRRRRDLPLATDEVAADGRGLGLAQAAGMGEEEVPRQVGGDVGVVHQPEAVLEGGDPGDQLSASGPSASRTNSSE